MLPASLLQFTGGLPNWTLPSLLQLLALNGGRLTGPLPRWKLPDGLSMLYL